MMEFIGWALCLFASIGGAFAAYVIVAMSGWNGKVDIVPLAFVVAIDSGLWYLAFTQAPFVIVLGG